MTEFQIHIKEKAYTSTNSKTRLTIADFDLSIAENEFVCLVGPSGCGKTTLLNIIAELDPHYQGHISLHRKKKETANIGYVFQNPRLLPWRTVRQNIELALQTPVDHSLIDELLSAMQLTEQQHDYPAQLSLGMSRRVAIIRAFAINPEVLLMDEPFVSLDAPTARQVRQLLITIWCKRPHSVLFVTHDLREAIALADRLIFLSSSPMSIVSDIPVTLNRESRDNETEIESFRQFILKQYPEIQSLL